MPINSYENYALSWRPVKERLTRPYYQSLVQQLEADILSGALQKNVKLPSQRELADYLDLNFTTIGQAYIPTSVAALSFLPTRFTQLQSLPTK